MIETIRYEAFSVRKLAGEWLIELFKDNCVPCKMLGKSLERVQDSARILKVHLADTDFEQASAELRVQSVPTVLLVRDGRVLHQTAGFKTPADLAQLLDRHFTGNAQAAEVAAA
jgi:thioredoxin-like negative regulator of GroEL